MPPDKTKKLLFATALTVLVYLVIELLSFGALTYLKKFKKRSFSPINRTQLYPFQKRVIQKLLDGELEYLAHDPVLGWSIQANSKSTLGRHTTNAHRIRSNRPFTKKPQPGVTRIATFGDSFMHGDEIRTEETWQELITASHDDIEVLNFGVPGFATDQAFLRYQHEGANFQPHIAILGYTLIDMQRSLGSFRPFFSPETGIPMTKPRFILTGDKLKLIPNPFPDVNNYKKLLNAEQHILPTLGKYDYYFKNGYYTGKFDFLQTVKLYKIGAWEWRKKTTHQNSFLKNNVLNTDSPTFIITAKIASAFQTLARENQTLPVIFYFPNRGDYMRYALQQHKIHDPLLEYLKQNNIIYLDLTDVLFELGKDYSLEELFTEGNHLSAISHGLIQKPILDFLSNHGLIVSRSP